MALRLRPSVTVAVLVTTALLAAGCGDDDDPTAATTSSTAAASLAGFPVTIQNCGKSFTFTRPPSRVVTGYHHTFETMVDLGLADRIVARVNFSENGPGGFRPGHKAIYDRIPEVSDSIDLPQKEVLIDQKPDFVIATSYGSFNASKGFATVEELSAAGAPAYITAGWCSPQGVKDAEIADIFTDVRNLGMIFGVQEAAARLAAELQGIIDDVSAKVKDRPPVDVLATDGGEGPVNAYGRRACSTR